MSDFLRTRPWTTPAMLGLFDDAATVAHALAFEVALARAQAAEGLITVEVAEAIASGCAAIVIDPQSLAEQAALAGTLAIAVVTRLRESLDGEAILALHHGATSQDLADTVLMRQVVAAQRLIDEDVERLCTALFRLAEGHAGRPAIGRTLLRDAVPIGFGLRLAQAAAGISQAHRRLATDVRAHAAIQLGGAAGTRADFGGAGASIARRMADELGLRVAEPWHARRVGIASIASALGILIGALGKLARDWALLGQNAVAEVSEPLIAGRGGSSAMAGKHNPTGCQVALSAALRAPGLVAGILGGLPQEYERGLGGWQAEGPALGELFLLAAGSAEARRTVAEGLRIDPQAIARNLTLAGTSEDIGESVALVAALIEQYQRK